MRKIILLGGLGLVGYGAYTYYKTEMAVLEQSEISLGSIKILDRSASNVTLNVSVKVKNNSEQEFIIRKYDFLLLINNSLIGKIQNSNLDTLVKGFGSTSIINFNFSFNPREIGIANILVQLASRQSNSTFTLRGNLSVKKSFITLSTPLDITYSLKELMA
jgi:hypothetical protein